MASEDTSGGESWRWVGCNFTPTDEELIGDLLFNKVRNLSLRISPRYCIPEMEVYKKPPWEFDSWLQQLPSHGRAVDPGSPTASPATYRIKVGGWLAIVGTRRSLKFFKDNDDPRKKDSSLGLNWIMHEYLHHPSLYEMIPSYETEEIILCRIQHKWRGAAADKSDGNNLPPLALPYVADTQETPEPLMAGTSTQSMAIDHDIFDFLEDLDVDLDFGTTSDPGLELELDL
ncbi:hypothetical protein OPV22_028151 [Ensete ventricosum]|uniref:NAC domain-containing protein n=1 Tax=Ensete ventricosum TaxID=4639 RepID=A0AAV8Q2A9_ENSVE|nr:hypothetical protein OPV22_028151 [Ensete ventricosum]